MPGFRPGARVRGSGPSRRTEDARHGLVEPRPLHLRRHVARGLRRPRRVARDGRGVAQRARSSAGRRGPTLPEVSLTDLAELRLAVSRRAGRPLILHRHTDPPCAASSRDQTRVASDERTDHADHVIRTKATPLIGRDVAAFAESCSAYFAKHARHARTQPTMLDPAPRVILDDELGMLTAGSSAPRRRWSPTSTTTRSPFSSGPRITSAATSRSRQSACSKSSTGSSSRPSSDARRPPR